MNHTRLQLLTQDWRRMLQYRDALFVLGFLLLATAPLFWMHRALWELGMAVGVLGVCPAYLYYRRPRLPRPIHVARYLDRTYPQLEESSLLWLRPPASLTLLERLQLARLNRAAELLFHRIPPPRFPGGPPWKLLRGAALFLIGSVCAVTVMGLVAPRDAARRIPVSSFPGPPSQPVAAVSKPSAPIWPKVVGAELIVTPPAYTGHPVRRLANLEAEVEENANVAWDITLDQPVRDLRLVFGLTGQNTFPLQSDADATHFRGSHLIRDAGFYSLAGTLPDSTPWTPPELHALKLIKDLPPVLRILLPEQPRTVIVPPPPVPFLFVPFGVLPLPASFIPHPASFSMAALASDDYGITDAHLVATVAKGSGEAVKFREQVFRFDSDTPAAEPPSAHRLTKTLDLTALGLEPGDELYFFVEALDNRQPTPNRTRSETRFVTLQGPVAAVTTLGRGVAGINLVPQYFRSERQIIIDTEKLLVDRSALTEPDFRARADDLGTDQSLLRLRYGRFLGEDQEESAVTDHTELTLDPLQAGVPESKPGPRAAASIALRFQQEHEEQAEGGDDARGPRPAPERPLTAEQIRAPYVDEHDSQDAATLFDRQAKGTMRDALSAMWQAEGFLRTARAQDALGPEHRALEILKAVQQSDRAYVQHVGFEAPPLKVAERRFKGDVAEVLPRAVAARVPVPDDAAVADVRVVLNALSQPGFVSAGILRQVEPILTAAAARRPDDLLPGLQALRRLESDPAADRAQDGPLLAGALLRLLPPVDRLPEIGAPPAPSLTAPYFQALQARER